MPCSSAAEAGIAWFCLASGAVHISISHIGFPEPAIVSSSSASSAERASSSNVHWDRNVVHTAGRVGGVEAIWVLLIVEPSVRIALEVSLKIHERSAAEPLRLKLRVQDVGRIAALLFQDVVEEFLAPGNLYGALF